MDKFELLKHYWGYSQFRPLQEKIIDAVLEGKDVLGLLPTGGGKSLCYQLPSLLLKGTVLVVSPLIALMEDQVKQAKAKGLKAMYFESHPKSLSIAKQLDNCIHGDYHLVYCSPERFLNSEFVQQLSSAKISLVAVDEAHCISEWGHDFRPAYRALSVLKTLFPHVGVLALTGSATPEVIKDIKVILNLEKALFFQRSFERKNIAYRIWKTEDKFTTILQLLKHHQGSGILYCNTRKQSEYLAQFLKENKFNADFFHGGLPDEEKKMKLTAWQQNETLLMVATTAFGMGIDKADVRLIIHLQLPSSIENYYQETGRAGRDQKPAFAYLLFHKGDVGELKSQFLDSLPTPQDIEGTYKDLCNFLQIAYGEGKDSFFLVNLPQFSIRYKRSANKIKRTLKLFEQAGVFQLIQNKETNLRIKTSASIEQLSLYSAKKEFSAQVLELLIRQHPQFTRVPILLNTSKMTKVLKCSKERLMESLETLKKQGFLKFDSLESTVYIQPLTPREDLYSILPVLDLAKKHYALKKSKVGAMIQYVKEESYCKRNALLRYFGEKLETNCGQCSANSCKSAYLEETDFKTKVIALLKTKPHSLQELKQKLYFEPQALEIQLRELLENHSIVEDQHHKYCWIYE